MKTIFAVLSTAGLCLCFIFAGAQTYSPKQLQEDYVLLRKTLETTYPSL